MLSLVPFEVGSRHFSWVNTAEQSPYCRRTCLPDAAGGGRALTNQDQLLVKLTAILVVRFIRKEGMLPCAFEKQNQINWVILTEYTLFLSATPFPHGFKCFTCEKAADNYECNRWAPDVYCPRGKQPHAGVTLPCTTCSMPRPRGQR